MIYIFYLHYRSDEEEGQLIIFQSSYLPVIVLRITQSSFGELIIEKRSHCQLCQPLQNIEHPRREQEGAIWTTPHLLL